MAKRRPSSTNRQNEQGKPGNGSKPPDQAQNDNDHGQGQDHGQNDQDHGQGHDPDDDGEEPAASGTRIGTAGARRILDLFRRHGGLRFDNASDKDFALQELAEMTVTGEDAPEAPHARAQAAHQGAQFQGEGSDNGAEDARRTDGSPDPAGITNNAPVDNAGPAPEGGDLQQGAQQYRGNADAPFTPANAAAHGAQPGDVPAPPASPEPLPHETNNPDPSTPGYQHEGD